ncbi:MAG: TRAP transporter large permease subunit, partial [Gammaproteobacteria bacterium]|jgi:TRAP-type C4-dicarboxylate transport system permease large subunit|nr:TRAP transporter large permease subunit [Gammaproteobacteria bacterium]
VVILLYIVLGFFVETLSLMVITIPIIAPILVGMGYDPIWFGILLILLIEMALITPPVGLNLFIASYRFDQPIMRVYGATFPFLIILLLSVIIITFWPGLSRLLID